MLSNHNSSIMSDLEYSCNTFVVAYNHHGHLGVHSDCSQFQVGSALVVEFAGVGQRVVEALDHVDV